MSGTASDSRFARYRIEREIGRGRPQGAPVTVGCAPTGLAVGGGAIWVANTADGTVLRLDPKGRRRARCLARS
jgi:streptogramin lyase